MSYDLFNLSSIEDPEIKATHYEILYKSKKGQRARIIFEDEAIKSGAIPDPNGNSSFALHLLKLRDAAEYNRKMDEKMRNEQ
jgi:hypothetical protein